MRGAVEPLGQTPECAAIVRLADGKAAHEHSPHLVSPFRVLSLPALRVAGGGRQHLDVVPVDYVANAMFTALGELLRQTGPGVRVYQSCSGSENPLTVGRITRIIREAFAAQRGLMLKSKRPLLNGHTPMWPGLRERARRYRCEFAYARDRYQIGRAHV